MYFLYLKYFTFFARAPKNIIYSLFFRYLGFFDKVKKGKNYLKLAKIAAAVSKKTKNQIIVATQAADNFRIKQQSKIKVF